MIGPCRCGHGIAMHRHGKKEGTAWCRRKTCPCALYRPTFGMPSAAHHARPDSEIQPTSERAEEGEQ